MDEEFQDPPVIIGRVESPVFHRQNRALKETFPGSKFPTQQVQTRLIVYTEGGEAKVRPWRHSDGPFEDFPKSELTPQQLQDMMKDDNWQGV